MASDLPIDRAALNAVRKALATLKEIEPLLDAAESAGFNVAEERARAEHYTGLSNGILTTYEPIINRIKGRLDD